MLNFSLSLRLAVVGIALSSAPVMAKNPSPKKLMELSAQCAYVTGIAEGNNIKLNYGSAEWINIIRLLEQKTGLDGEQSLNLAKAKYGKRANVMGADEAFKYMLGRAQDCDREMAVIQS